ncbi:uncharacterized protein G2W53_039631 [Senna tora]|uniref:Uncharacterized protein n=1 Tax=Senna tora TaxID=362788 RepID=A0A834W307_9FABA|nr:uncharacterized protein G2W53_039631 [Senna tora]
MGRRDEVHTLTALREAHVAHHGEHDRLVAASILIARKKMSPQNCVVFGHIRNPSLPPFPFTLSQPHPLLSSLPFPKNSHQTIPSPFFSDETNNPYHFRPPLGRNSKPHHHLPEPPQSPTLFPKTNHTKNSLTPKPSLTINHPTHLHLSLRPLSPPPLPFAVSHRAMSMASYHPLLPSFFPLAGLRTGVRLLYDHLLPYGRLI